MVEVTIFSRRECHLCKVAMKVAHCVQEETPFRQNGINFHEDPALFSRYGSRVPVVLVDQVEMFSGRIGVKELRRAVRNARWRRPVSRILSRLRLRRQRG